MARINLSKGLNGGSKSRYFAKSLYPFEYLKIIALVICLLMIPALSILIDTSSVPGKSSIIDPSNQTTTTSTYPTTTPSTRGNPRPDEVDLYGNNVWKTDADVPAHNNLGFRVMSGASLTIYAGVTVKFDSGRQLFVEGQLKILGTKSSMVNLSTKSASPAKGDWGGVKYGTGSSGFINSTRIMYSTIGVNLFDAKNIIISNCTIHDSEYGMRLESTSDNNKIIKNEIFDCDTGMAILDSDNNDIIENEIYNLSILSLSMGDQANNNDIKSNSLYNSGIRGISLSGNANNNSFFDNEIHTNVEDGFRFVGAPDNTLESNQIYSNKNGIISYSGSDRNILTGNSIYQNTEAGLNFVGGDDWLLSENSFSNNYYGILSSSSQGIECNNDTISVSTFADIDLNKDSELSVINCSFQKNLAFVHDSSVLKVYWYLIIEMRDDTGKLTKGKVEVKNAMDDVIRPNSWANDGICWVKCLGFIQTETGKDKSQNPYWFVVNDGEQEFNYGEDVSSQSVVFKIRFVYLPEEFSFPEDTKYEIKLSKYFNIFENQNFEIDIISGGNISYIFDEDNLKLSAKPPENWVGSETIQISATPNLGDADIEITRFNVTPVNDPPNIIQLIPNQLKKEGAPSWTLDLTEYGFDVDLEFGDSLTWSVSDVNESLLNITVLDNGHVLKFSLASPDNYGNNRVNIWVEDNYGESDSQYIWINVTPENDGPILKDMAVLPKSGSPSDNFNFTVQYFDPDGDLPDYIIIKINNKITYQLLETNINDKNVIDGKEYYYQMKLSSQEYFFWFECQDSYGIFAKSDRVSGPIVAIAELGSLNGWVRDKETGSPIADSEITVNDLQNSSFQVKVQTGFDGNYTVLNLQPGINRYQIYATATGYRDSKLFNRTIIKGGVSIMNFDLEKLPGDIVDTKITSIQLEANRTNISMYDAISFTGFGEDLDGDILIYTWDFGDGTKIVQGKKVSHSFHEAGIFNVSLKIEDTDGNNLTSNVQITVNPSPGTNTTNGDGSSTTGSSNLFGDNPTLVIGIILLIGIIIILIAIFIQIQHKKEEEELRLQEDETARRRAISRARRERRRREKEMEFVDREKRNVEQVNLIISDLHRSKLQQRREKKGKSIKEKPKSKQKHKPIRKSRKY